MAEDEIRYDVLTQDALRGVVREVLARHRPGLSIGVGNLAVASA